MSYTSNSELDLEKRVQITNEVPPYGYYDGLNSVLKNAYWEWFLGSSIIVYDCDYSSDDNTKLNDDTYFAKIINGVVSDNYGPKMETVWDKDTQSYISKSPTFHRMELDGTLIVEQDLFLHEIYRYMSTLYPDSEDFTKLLTNNEINEAFNSAAAIVNYKPNNNFFELVAKSLDSSASEDDIEVESLKIKLRNLRNNSYRRKLYGSQLGYRMFCGDIFRTCSLFIMGTYLPLYPSAKGFSSPKERNVNTFHPLYNRKFRLIDWDGSSSSVYKEEKTSYSFYGYSLPEMGYRIYQRNNGYLTSSVIDNIEIGSEIKFGSLSDLYNEGFYEENSIELLLGNDKNSWTEFNSSNKALSINVSKKINPTYTSFYRYKSFSEKIGLLSDTEKAAVINDYSDTSKYKFFENIYKESSDKSNNGIISFVKSPYFEGSFYLNREQSLKIYPNNINAAVNYYILDVNETPFGSNLPVSVGEVLSNEEVNDFINKNLSEENYNDLCLLEVTGITKGLIKFSALNNTSAYISDTTAYTDDRYAVAVEDISGNTIILYGNASYSISSNYATAASFGIAAIPDKKPESITRMLFSEEIDSLDARLAKLQLLIAKETDESKLAEYNLEIEECNNSISKLYSNDVSNFNFSGSSATQFFILSSNGTEPVYINYTKAKFSISYIDFGTVDTVPLLFENNINDSSSIEENTVDGIKYFSLNDTTKSKNETIDNYTHKYYEYNLSFDDILIPDSNVITATAQDKSKVSIVGDITTSDDSLLNVITFTTDESKERYKTLSVGDQVYGIGIKDDSHVLEIGSNEITLDKNVEATGTYTFVFLTKMDIYAEDITENFYQYKTKLNNDGTMLYENPFKTGLWPSKPWPNVSKTKIDGLLDISFFNPYNNDLKATTSTSGQTFFQVVQFLGKNYYSASETKDKNLIPSTIKYNDELFLDINLNSLINIKNRLSTYPNLINVEWLDYLESNLNDISRASDSVNVGAQLTIESDSSGIYSLIKNASYTDPNINLKCQTFGWDESTIPMYAQVGSRSTADNTSSGSIDFSNTTLKRLSIYGMPLWGQKIYHADETSSQTTSKVNDIVNPIFEIQLGEYDIQKNYLNNENNYTTVALSFYKKEVENLEKKILKSDSNAIKILSSKYTTKNFMSLDESVTIIKGLECLGTFNISENSSYTDVTQPDSSEALSLFKNKNIVGYYLIEKDFIGTVNGITKNFYKNDIYIFNGTDFDFYSLKFGGLIQIANNENDSTGSLVKGNKFNLTVVDAKEKTGQIEFLKNTIFYWWPNTFVAGDPTATDDSANDHVYAVDKDIQFKFRWFKNKTEEYTISGTFIKDNYVVSSFDFSVPKEDSSYFNFYNTIYSDTSFISNIIDEHTNSMSLPDKTITPGSFNINYTVYPHFTAEGYLYSDFIKNGSSASKVEFFVSQNPIKYDSSNDVFYEYAQYELKSSGKTVSSDSGYANIAIIFEENSYFKDTYFMTGTYALKKSINSGSSEISTSPVITKIDGIEMDFDNLSTGDKVLSAKQVFLRSIYNSILESYIFSNSTSMTGSVYGITPEGLLLIGPKRTSDSISSNISNFSVILKNIAPSSYDTSSNEINFSSLGYYPVLKNIKLTSSIVDYTKESSDDESDFKYFKNLLLFKGIVNSTTSSKVTSDGSEYFTKALSVLKKGDSIVNCLAIADNYKITKTFNIVDENNSVLSPTDIYYENGFLLVCINNSNGAVIYLSSNIDLGSISGNVSVTKKISLDSEINYVTFDSQEKKFICFDNTGRMISVDLNNASSIETSHEGAQYKIEKASYVEDDGEKVETSSLQIACVDYTDSSLVDIEPSDSNDAIEPKYYIATDYSESVNHNKYAVGDESSSEIVALNNDALFVKSQIPLYSTDGSTISKTGNYSTDTFWKRATLFPETETELYKNLKSSSYNDLFLNLASQIYNFEVYYEGLSYIQNTGWTNKYPAESSWTYDEAIAFNTLYNFCKDKENYIRTYDQFKNQCVKTGDNYVFKSYYWKVTDSSSINITIALEDQTVYMQFTAYPDINGDIDYGTAYVSYIYAIMKYFFKLDEENATSKAVQDLLITSTNVLFIRDEAYTNIYHLNRQALKDVDLINDSNYWTASRLPDGLIYVTEEESDKAYYINGRLIVNSSSYKALTNFKINCSYSYDDTVILAGSFISRNTFDSTNNFNDYLNSDAAPVSSINEYKNYLKRVKGTFPCVLLSTDGGTSFEVASLPESNNVPQDTITTAQLSNIKSLIKSGIEKVQTILKKYVSDTRYTSDPTSKAGDAYQYLTEIKNAGEGATVSICNSLVENITDQNEKSSTAAIIESYIYSYWNTAVSYIEAKVDTSSLINVTPVYKIETFANLSGTSKIYKFVMSTTSSYSNTDSSWVTEKKILGNYVIPSTTTCAVDSSKSSGYSINGIDAIDYLKANVNFLASSTTSYSYYENNSNFETFIGNLVDNYAVEINSKLEKDYELQDEIASFNNTSTATAENKYLNTPTENNYSITKVFKKDDKVVMAVYDDITKKYVETYSTDDDFETILTNQVDLTTLDVNTNKEVLCDNGQATLNFIENESNVSFTGIGSSPSISDVSISSVQDSSISLSSKLFSTLDKGINVNVYFLVKTSEDISNPTDFIDINDSALYKNGALRFSLIQEVDSYSNADFFYSKREIKANENQNGYPSYDDDSNHKFYEYEETIDADGNTQYSELSFLNSSGNVIHLCDQDCNSFILDSSSFNMTNYMNYFEDIDSYSLKSAHKPKYDSLQEAEKNFDAVSSLVSDSKVNTLASILGNDDVEKKITYCSLSQTVSDSNGIGSYALINIGNLFDSFKNNTQIFFASKNELNIFTESLFGEYNSIYNPFETFEDRYTLEADATKWYNGLYYDKSLNIIPIESNVFFNSNVIMDYTSNNNTVVYKNTPFTVNSKNQLYLGSDESVIINGVYLNPLGYGGSRENLNWDSKLPWDLDKEAFSSNLLYNVAGEPIYLTDKSGNKLTTHALSKNYSSLSAEITDEMTDYDFSFTNKLISHLIYNDSEYENEVSQNGFNLLQDKYIKYKLVNKDILSTSFEYDDDSHKYYQKYMLSDQYIVDNDTKLKFYFINDEKNITSNSLKYEVYEGNNDVYSFISENFTCSDDGLILNKDISELNNSYDILLKILDSSNNILCNIYFSIYKSSYVGKSLRVLKEINNISSNKFNLSPDYYYYNEDETKLIKEVIKDETVSTEMKCYDYENNELTISNVDYETDSEYNFIQDVTVELDSSNDAVRISYKKKQEEEINSPAKPYDIIYFSMSTSNDVSLKTFSFFVPNYTSGKMFIALSKNILYLYNISSSPTGANLKYSKACFIKNGIATPLSLNDSTKLYYSGNESELFKLSNGYIYATYSGSNTELTTKTALEKINSDDTLELRYTFDGNRYLSKNYTLKLVTSTDEINYIYVDNFIIDSVNKTLKYTFGTNSVYDSSKNNYVELGNLAGYTQLRVPLYRNFKNLINSKGFIIPYKDITLSSNIIKFSSVDSDNGNVVLSSGINDEIEDDSIIEIRLLTKKTVSASIDNMNNDDYIYKLSDSELSDYPYDRIYYNSAGYPRSPIYDETNNVYYYTENNSVYKKDYLINNNNKYIHECDSTGHYIRWYTDNGELKSETLPTSLRNYITKTADSRFVPYTPEYSSCSDWFKSYFYLNGSEKNPFWQKLTFLSKYNMFTKKYVQTYSLKEYKKSNENMILVDPDYPYFSVYKAIDYSLSSDEDLQTLVYSSEEANYLNLKKGILKFILSDINSYYNSDDNSDIVKYGIHANNTLKGNKTFTENTYDTCDSIFDCSYYAYSNENIANPQDKNMAITHIDELGLFNASHNLIFYAIFPQIEYRSDTQHVDFNIIVNNEKNTPEAAGYESIEIKEIE